MNFNFGVVQQERLKLTDLAIGNDSKRAGIYLFKVNSRST